jgi:hypothetical protein
MVKISINPKYTNKLPANTQREVWRDFNGSFENRTVPPKLFLRSITQGRAYTTHHDRYRKSDNFLCAQHLATDHDTDDYKSSIDYLSRDPFVRKYAYAIHSTPSSTTETPRSRVVYIIDRPVVNKSAYVKMTEAICHKFDDSDSTTKDACRFFFGNDSAEVNLLGNIISVETIGEKLVMPHMEYKKEEDRKRAELFKDMRIVNRGAANTALLDSIIDREVSRVVEAADGEKYYTLLKVARTLGGYASGGYFSTGDVRSILTDAIQRRNIDSLDTALVAIDSGISYGAQQPLYITERDPWMAL